jgi:hypothetical protein
VNNTSTVAIDVNIGSNGWSSGGSAWTYGAAGADTGQLKASGTQGGAGGSTGAGNFDKTVPNGSTALLCDALSAVTNFAWELQLETPASFSHGDQQTTTVTLTAVAN